jgi:peptidoglycan hydrolase FlgJ
MRIDTAATQHVLQSMQTQKNNVEDTTFKAKLDSAMSDPDKQKLRAACQDFEAVFLNMMLQSMRATVPKSDFFGRNSGEELFKSMLDQETTKNMAKAGGAGLADMLYKQLVKEQALTIREQKKINA